MPRVAGTTPNSGGEGPESQVPLRQNGNNLQAAFTLVTLDQRPHLLTQFPDFFDGATSAQGRWLGRSLEEILT